MEIFLGIMIPFIGTTAGAACVFFLKNQLKPLVQKALLGFASGVMVAASVWSLLIPAMNQSEHLGKFAFMPAAAGFLLGILFLLLMDKLTPHLHLGCTQAEGPHCKLKKSTMLVLAVTLHNIPEGMAVGVVFAGMMAENAQITIAGANGSFFGNSNSELSGGGNYFPSAEKRGRGWQRKGIFVWYGIRNRGACCGRSDTSSVSLYRTSLTLSIGFCRRSYDLCCSRRIDTGVQ